MTDPCLLLREAICQNDHAAVQEILHHGVAVEDAFALVLAVQRATDTSIVDLLLPHAHRCLVDEWWHAVAISVAEHKTTIFDKLIPYVSAHDVLAYMEHTEFNTTDMSVLRAHMQSQSLRTAVDNNGTSFSDNTNMQCGRNRNRM